MAGWGILLPPPHPAPETTVDRNEEPTEPTDPFAGLEDWAQETERRVRRETRRLPRPRRSGSPSPLRSALLVAAVAVGAVVVAAAVPELRSFLPVGSRSSVDTYPTSVVPSGITVTTSESAAPADPFAGTPAASYPQGAAGITLPAARRVAGFSAAQVGADLRKVRAAMIAGRLDTWMLVGHQSDRFLRLLAPGDRNPVQQEIGSSDTDNVATWIDPAVRLDPAQPPRVSGRVTYRSVRLHGVETLRVTTNFVWVYAFAGPPDRLAAEHDEINWEFPDAANLLAADRGMWVGDNRSYAAWIDCTAARLGLLAPTRADAAPAPSPSDTEDPNDYLRANHALTIPDDCRAASKSPSPAASRG